jgi:integrase
MPRKHRRVRVERNLYRAGNAFYACATPPGGRQAVWQPLGEVGIMEARRLRDEFVASIRRTTPRIAPSRLSFGAVADEWLATQVDRVALDELAPRTLEAYDGALHRYVLPVFGSRPVRSVTADDLVCWHRGMRRRGLARATVRVAWTPLRLILDYAVRHHGLQANPADRLLSHEIPKPGPSRQRFLSRDEVARLLDAAVDPYRPAIAVGVLAGLRVSEILGLRWDDVDAKAGFFRVRGQLGRDGEHRASKTPAGRREVILIPQLGRMLLRFRLASRHTAGGDLLFATANGRSIGDRNLAQRGVENACSRAGLEDVLSSAAATAAAPPIEARRRDAVRACTCPHEGNPRLLRQGSHRGGVELRAAPDRPAPAGFLPPSWRQDSNLRPPAPTRSDPGVPAAIQRSGASSVALSWAQLRSVCSRD